MLPFITETLGWRFLLALILSLTLWARLTLAQNPERVDVYPTDIPVEVRNLPAGLVVANDIPAVKLRIAAPQESWRFLEPSSFRATVDLGNASPGLMQADINVESVDPQVRILESTPSKESLRIEELKTKTVPVQVTQTGSVPFGFRVGEPVVKPASVEVSGPSSAVDKVTVAGVTVSLDNARSTVDRSIKPEPRGPNGVVTGVRVDPQTVTVTLPIEQIAGSKVVSVVPQVKGQPAPGYWQGPITVEPTAVQIVGDPSILDTVSVLNTAEVDISGAQTEVTKTVAITHPAGVSLVRDQNATVRVSVLPLQGQQVRDVAVTPINGDPTLAATITPRTISVTLSGPQPTLLALGPTDVTATVDLSGVAAGTQSLPIQVVAPSTLHVDHVTPDHVTVTLTTIVPPTSPADVAVPEPASAGAVPAGPPGPG